MTAMTKRQFYTILLLTMVLPIREAWTLWKDSDRIVDWFLLLDYPLSIQWYFKFLGLNIADLLLAAVIYRCSRLYQTFRMAATVFLIISVVDVVMFFVNFNKGSYLLIYSLISLIALVAAYSKSIKYEKEAETKPPSFRRMTKRVEKETHKTSQ